MSQLRRSRFAFSAAGSIGMAVALALTLASFGGASSNTPGVLLTPGAMLAAQGSFVDNGTTYTFGTNANESATVEGEGSVGLGLGGPGLSLCSVHGPGGGPPGSFPLAQVQCGGASSQAVSIKDCKAEIELHAYVHSDFPHKAIFLGTTTVAIEFHKKGPNSGDIKVTIYTPKTKVEVGGPVTTTSPISMSTCP